jgi:hypothetical protein
MDAGELICSCGKHINFEEVEKIIFATNNKYIHFRLGHYLTKFEQKI